MLDVEVPRSTTIQLHPSQTMKTTLHSLPGVPWPQVPGPYLSNSADFFLTTNAPIGNAFFRLHKP